MDIAFYKDKSILITGGAGSIGTQLCLQLLDYAKREIVILDNSELAIYKLQIKVSEQHTYRDIVFKLADIRNKAHIEKIIETHKPNVVFHAAALKQLPLLEAQPSETVQTNILGSLNLIKLSIENEVDKFVFISTDKAVEPSSVMGMSKQIVERYLRSINVTKTVFSTVRFGNVYNSNGSAIPLFKDQIQNGGPVTITHPNIERFFISIKKACQSILAVASIATGQEIFVIDMGAPQKISLVIQELIKHAGISSEKQIEIKVIGLRKGEKIKEKLIEDGTVLTPSEVNEISYFKLENPLDLTDLENVLEFSKRREDDAVHQELLKLSKQ
ncbi:polysaccharide biosynthesis protein [Winogradskyella maritima]|uniref:Polysaccharide biosynthesis protein n=1 Tax=Winogradskyella maritima TaxID=1517766 RepID=A0ABV8ADK3_9FLAO|nr:polysaccharide biosynthesis protein [Winogradskyella maritima]